MPSSASATSMSTIAHSYVQTQEQLLTVEKKRSGLYIGIPRESTLQENRVALIPSSVATLTARGHRVVIETGAGEPANFTDHEYSEAGAEIDRPAGSACRPPRCPRPEGQQATRGHVSWYTGPESSGWKSPERRSPPGPPAHCLKTSAA